MSWQPPRMVVCVGAVVIQDKSPLLQNQRVLFVRQAYGRYLGQWSIPWGFVADNDDGSSTPDQAALNETLEEAGIAAEIVGFLGVQNDRRTDSNEAWLYLLYLCRHVGGVPTPDNHETDKAAYLSLADMDTLDEPIEPFCDWLVRRVLNKQHHLIKPEPDNPFAPHLAFL